MQPSGDPAGDLGLDHFQVLCGRGGDGPHALEGLLTIGVAGRWHVLVAVAEAEPDQVNAVRLLPSGSAWFLANRTNSTAAFIGNSG